MNNYFEIMAMQPNDSIFVAGHRGLVGSATVRALTAAGFTRIIGRTRASLDLRDPQAVVAFFQDANPDYVILAAARVGGILANTNAPADFIRDNLLVQTNVVDAAYQHGVKKLLFLGSSCIYPRLAPQPIHESALMTGPLESTNEAYATAKIAGIATVQAYRRQFGFNGICVMPTNLYGPGDNFDGTTSHLLPGLIAKMHHAKTTKAEVVLLWGTGTPRRELLHVDDAAKACVHLMRTYDSGDIVNIGTGEDASIREIAELVADVIGYKGRLDFDASRPDGTPRKQLDVTRLHALGWRHEIPLRRGIEETYAWYTDHCAELRP